MFILRIFKLNSNFEKIVVQQKIGDTTHDDNGWEYLEVSWDKQYKTVPLVVAQSYNAGTAAKPIAIIPHINHKIGAKCGFYAGSTTTTASIVVTAIGFVD